MNEPQNLDPVAIERLQRLGGAEFVGKMIDLFVSYGGEKVAEARKAQLAGDCPGLAKAVHPIKSSAGNVGASRVQQLAVQLEALAKQGQAESLAGLIAELEQAFAAVKSELERQRR